MEIVILLVPLAFLLLAVGIWAFVWAMRGGQFDDLESPKYRILFDDQAERQFDAEADSDDSDSADSARPHDNTATRERPQ